MFEAFPINKVDFDRRFHSEHACHEYLFQLRWPEGFSRPIVVTPDTGSLHEGFASAGNASISNQQQQEPSFMERENHWVVE